MAFVCICNPVEIWDYEAFFRGSPDTGYWVFPKATYDRVRVGDRLFLHVTARSGRPGIYGLFHVTGKREDACPTDHWRPGKIPRGQQPIVDFEVRRLLHGTGLPHANLKSLLPASSGFVRAVRSKAAEVLEEEADQVEALL